ncbi:MAG: S-layer homology domain-containing protein [Candidatus Gracilibacteria bacterium]
MHNSNTHSFFLGKAKKIISMVLLVLMISPSSFSLVQASEEGLLSPGVNTYPNLGIRQTDYMSSNGYWEEMEGALFDENNDTAYYATGSNPASILKMRISDGKILQRQSYDYNNAESNFISGFMDSAKEYAYYVGGNNSKTTFIKIRLSDLELVSNITISNAASYSSKSSISADGLYAYVAVNNSTGRFLKIRLSDMVIESQVAVPNGSNSFSQYTLDEANGYAYAANFTWGNQVYLKQIRLSDFTVTATLPIGPAFAATTTYDFDIADQKMYIVVDDAVPVMMKLDLATMTVDQSVNIYGAYADSEFDFTQGKAYIMSGSAPTKLESIDLDTMSVLDTLTLTQDYQAFTSGIFTLANNNQSIVYATGSLFSEVTVIDLGSFTEAGTINFNPLPDHYYNSFIKGEDDKNIYLVTAQFFNSPEETAIYGIDVDAMNAIGNVELLDQSLISYFQAPQAKTIHMFTAGDVQLGNNLDIIDLDTLIVEDHYEIGLSDGAAKFSTYDPVGGFLYVVTETNHNDSDITIMKVDAKTFEYVDQFIGTTPGSSSDANIIFDPIRNKLYIAGRNFNGSGYPNVMLKIDAATMTEEAVLDTGDAAFTNGLVFDSTTSYLYGATRDNVWNQSVGRIGKIDLQTFTVVDTVDTPQWGWTGGGINNTTGKLYFGDEDSGDFIQVDADTLQIDDTLSAATESTNTVVIDEANNIAYISGEHWTNLGSEVAKIDLATFTKVASIRLSEPQNPVYMGALDAAKGLLYFAAGWPAKLHTVQTSDFTQINELSFDPKLESLDNLQLDTERGFIYGGTYTYPAFVTRIGLSQKGMVHATKMTLSQPASIVNALRFYSHSAAGNIELALYDDQKQLLWESGSVPNNKTNGWVTVPVANGSPTTLTSLPAGDYWIAYQTDSTASAPSLTSGSLGDGLVWMQEYGTFPSSLQSSRLSTEQWTTSAIYNLNAVITETSGTTLITEDGGTDTYSIVLTEAPTADVEVAINTTGGIIADTATLTFTSSNWNVPQIVTLNITNDNTANGNRTATISHVLTTTDEGYATVSIPDLTVTIEDTVIPVPPAGPAPTTGGGGGGYTPVAQLNVNTNIQPTTNQNSNVEPRGENANTNSSVPGRNTNGNTAPTRPSAPEVVNPNTPVGRFNIPFKDTICAPMKSQDPAIAESISQEDLKIFIENLLKKGVAFQRQGEVFDPAASVNRSEMLRYIIQGNCEDFRNYSEFPAPFSDVAITHQDALFIYLAKLRSIVRGYIHDGTFKPDNSITRAEALKIILEMTLSDGKFTFSGSAEPFTDVSWKDENTWYKGYLSYAVEKGIVTVSESKLFRPNDKALKSEIIFMLARSMKVKNQ